MEFRLTYAGPLFATQRDPLSGRPPRHTQNRHHIRKTLHHQLKRLWDTMEQDRASRPWKLLYGRAIESDGQLSEAPVVDREGLANRHSRYGFDFVPLVTQELDLICSIEILFLRPDKPGSVVWGGDIDNRLKTLFDAMRIPEEGEEYVNRTPADDEMPFYCLLEDDKLISRISVDTDTLLEPVDGAFHPSHARLVIKVGLQSQVLAPHNVDFMSFVVPRE